jgi:hypothetical protein
MPATTSTEERPRQLRLFAPPKPLTERFGAEFFGAIPETPGVYRMYDAADRIIYVGQSHDLRERLNSYRHVHPDRDSRKTIRLVHAVRRIDWEACATPAAARLRENELLRTLRPRFNRVNVWPWSCFYIGWREHTSALELALTREPRPGWQTHGAFRGGARYAFAALANLSALTLTPPSESLANANSESTSRESRSDRGCAKGQPQRAPNHCVWSATQPRSISNVQRDDTLLGNSDPEPLLPLFTEPQSDSLLISAHTGSGITLAPTLRAYLEGESPELISIFLEALARLTFTHRFAETLLLDELAALESFFRSGPQRLRRLRQIHSLPPGLIAPEKILDLIALDESEL